MTITLTSELLSPTGMRQSVEAALEDFLEVKSERASGTELALAIGHLRDFLRAGGKRIRPVMCLCGWYAASGPAPPAAAPEPVVRAAASLELFHTFALIHDDIMDRSATRRGRPTLHRTLADRRAAVLAEGSENFGAAAALLLGDLAFAWSDELLHQAGLDPLVLAEVEQLLDVMRDELMAGQYRDLSATGRLSGDVAQALHTSRFKTATYTIERPLQVGITLAGGDLALREIGSAYGIPVGEAFQLRDDILGVFGDPRSTGKPIADDLREGKATVLMAYAVSRATPEQRRILERHVGNAGLTEAQAESVRAVLLATGARAETERMIAERCRTALAVLDRSPFPEPVAEVLRRLARTAAQRTA